MPDQPIQHHKHIQQMCTSHGCYNPDDILLTDMKTTGQVRTDYLDIVQQTKDFLVDNADIPLLHHYCSMCSICKFHLADTHLSANSSEDKLSHCKLSLENLSHTYKSRYYIAHCLHMLVSRVSNGILKRRLPWDSY